MERDSDRLTIRTLRATDIDRLVKMDHDHTGRNRRAWFEGKLQRALADADVKISLGAEFDGLLVGALLGQVHYGEFGRPEPAAILDTILVDRSSSRRGIGRALVDQLLKNLSALGIERVRTEVAWNEQDLIGFLGRTGFVPAPRLVLELDVAEAKKREEQREAMAEA